MTKMSKSIIPTTQFKCSITLSIIKVPVIGRDGRTYEKHAITTWLLEHGAYPRTRRPVSVNDILPNRSIAGFLADNIQTYSSPNTMEQSPGKLARGKKSAHAFRYMTTVKEETNQDIEQDERIPRTSLRITASASDLAMSIINNENNIKRATVAESVECMVKLIQCGNQREKEIGACALHRLAVHEKNRSIIAQRGGIPPLLGLIQNGTTLQKNQAMAAIAALAVRNDANKVSIAQAGGISSLLRLTQSGTNKQKSLAVRGIYCLAKHEKIRDEIFRRGGLAPIASIAIKTDTNPNLKRYARATLRLLTVN